MRCARRALSIRENYFGSDHELVALSETHLAQALKAAGLVAKDAPYLDAIDVYNEGRMKRDFTYVDDIVEGGVRVIPRPAAPNPEWRSDAPDF